ncbi:MAG: hypothetical protein HY259_02615 [Chloroflexi bacterium]|nr:hypothetical protein [Chloroflexota bacterium]
MSKPSDIKNPQLRALVTAAHDAVRRGDYTASVKHSTEAVRQLLMVRPDVFSAGPRAGTRYVFQPLVGVRVVTEGYAEPVVIFDREKFGIAEALTWYEYALENIVIGEPQA